MSNFYTEPFVSAGEMEFPSQPYITAQPQNHTATGPEEYVLKVIAAGAVSYQWEVFDGESWSTIIGATSDTLTINIDSSMNGWRYRVLVTGADGSTVVSKAAQIAVKGVQEITLEGAIVTFDGPARIKSLETDINPVQSGTGDPSPDNIRPISGWSTVNVVRTGKNLFDKADAITLYCDGSIKLVDNATFKSVCIPLKDGVTYSYSQSVLGQYARFALVNSITANAPLYNPVTKVSGMVSRDGATPPISFTFTNTDFKYLVCTIYRSTTDADYDAIADTCQLELGSTASSYEEYQGNTYPISLGQTVYGGVLDVVSGELLDDWYLKTYTGNENFSNYATVLVDSTTSPVGYAQSADYIICSHGTYANAIRFSNSAKNSLQFPKTFFGVSDDTEFKALLTGWYNNGTPLQVCYRLATGQTTQLTPTDISTLTGVNNIWADSGDIRVTIIR